MFSFTGRNICQSLRSIISTLFYVHSLCLCWVHTCVLSLLLGEEEKVSKLFVSLSTRREKRTGRLFDDWQKKFCHAVFIKILQQSFQWNNRPTLEQSFLTGQKLRLHEPKNNSEQHGHVTHTCGGKTNDAVLRNGTISLQTASGQSHSSFSFNSKRLLYGERLQEASPPLAEVFTTFPYF